MTDKSPFTKVELQTIEAMIMFDGDTRKAAEHLGVETYTIDNRFARLRKKIETAQLIVNVSNNWRMNKAVRKRLTT